MQTFSMGTVYAVPSGANPTVIPFGILKSGSADIDQEKIELRGQYKAPIDVADGELSIAIKIAHADFRASMLAMLSTGSTTVTGSKLPAVSEARVIPTTPFQVTVTNSATFVEDGGVLDLTAGK